MKRVVYSALSLSLIFLLGACGGGKADESALPTRVPTLSAEILTPQPLPTMASLPTAAPVPSATLALVEPTAAPAPVAPSTAITPTEPASAITTAAATSAGAISNTQEIISGAVTETATTTPSNTISATVTTTTTESAPTAASAGATGEVDPAWIGLPADLLAAMKKADPARGKLLTATYVCIGCHNLNPTVKLVGPTWNNLATTAEHRIPGMSSGLYLYNSIVHPNDYVVEGYPSGVIWHTFGNLPAHDLADLISFLLTLKEHP